jgi:hypothetical protein
MFVLRVIIVGFRMKEAGYGMLSIKKLTKMEY